jgi:hypothetical protein
MVGVGRELSQSFCIDIYVKTFLLEFKHRDININNINPKNKIILKNQ